MNKLVDLEDAASRFRVGQACVGLVGCLCVCYAVWTPYWFASGGLWAEWNITERSPTDGGITEVILARAQEAEQFFGVMSSLMAVSAGALCLVFALCWSSRTVHSYSNARSLLRAGQTLYPTTLLLLTLGTTGFFFLLTWTLFTCQHREDIRHNVSALGSSYWLGALGWSLLLLVQLIVYLVEQCFVPDPLPDLKKTLLDRQFSSHRLPAGRHTSEPCYSKTKRFQLRRVVSLA